jgi:hypothetical protein
VTGSAAKRAESDRAAPRQEPRDRGEVGRQLCRGTIRVGLGAIGPPEELARRQVAPLDQRRQAGEHPFGATQRTAGDQRVVDDRVRDDLVPHPHQHARALTPLAQQAELAERRQVPGNIGLALLQQLAQLADRELLLGPEREQTQPDRLPEDPVQLPALVALDHLHGCCSMLL